MHHRVTNYITLAAGYGKGKIYIPVEKVCIDKNCPFQFLGYLD